MIDETFVAHVMVHQLSRECILISDPRDGSSVWDELGQRTIARLIYTQTDYNPSVCKYGQAYGASTMVRVT